MGKKTKKLQGGKQSEDQEGTLGSDDELSQQELEELFYTKLKLKKNSREKRNETIEQKKNSREKRNETVEQKKNSREKRHETVEQKKNSREKRHETVEQKKNSREKR